MTKEEYMAMSLPYGLKALRAGYSEPEKYYDLQYISYSSKFIRPVCRPLSDLTEEIVQADYNDGKPFVALDAIVDEIEMYDAFKFWIDAIYSRFSIRENLVLKAPFEIAQMLLKWHFAIGLKEEEFVPVTDEFNPYK